MGLQIRDSNPNCCADFHRRMEKDEPVNQLFLQEIPGNAGATFNQNGRNALCCKIVHQFREGDMPTIAFRSNDPASCCLHFITPFRRYMFAARQP
ncbi:hypothetical protein D9M68_995160 [compost metagenome]